MKVNYEPIDTTKPCYAVFVKDIPLIGMPFKYTTISNDSKRLDTWSKIVMCISIIGVDAYQVETEDGVYYAAIE